MAEQWPTATPRDELLARVATTGRRRLVLRRFAALGAAAAVATSAAVGLGVGRSGGIDLVAEPISIQATSDGVAPFSACPAGAPIGALHRDDRVYLTGRTEDAGWVELRSPADDADRVWVQTVLVGPDEDVDGLPVHPCAIEGDQLAIGGQPTTTLPPTTVPGETTTTSSTVPGETTTTAPGETTTTTKPPAPTTTTTAAPDLTPPSVSGLAAQVNEIYTDEGLCGSVPMSTAVEALVTDAGGVGTVRLGWSFTGANGTVSGSKSMTLSGGRYRATFGPFPDGTIAQDGSVTVTWTVRAEDLAGNPRQVSVNKAERVKVWDSCFG